MCGTWTGSQAFQHSSSWVRRSLINVQRSTRPRTRLAQVSVRLGMAALMSQQQFNNRCFTAARVASSKLTWLVSSGLPRSCVHGSVTRLWHHALIHPIPSSCRLHPTPRSPSARRTESIPRSRRRYTVLSALGVFVPMSAGFGSLCIVISSKRPCSIAP